jgi:hypothetical protein
MIGLLVALLQAGGVPRNAGSGCLPNDRSMNSMMLDVKQGIVTNQPTGWHRIVLAPADTFHVFPITADSLCDKALVTIRSWLVDSTYWPYRLRLVRVGDYVIAEDAGKPGAASDSRAMFFFTFDLNTVVYPCRNGGPCGR